MAYGRNVASCDPLSTYTISLSDMGCMKNTCYSTVTTVQGRIRIATFYGISSGDDSWSALHSWSSLHGSRPHKVCPRWLFWVVQEEILLDSDEFSSLRDIAEVVEACSGANTAQVVGWEDQGSEVPTYDFQTFPTPYFRLLEGVKSLHHFRYCVQKRMF